MEKAELLLFKHKLVWLKQENGFGLYLYILNVGDENVAGRDWHDRNYVLAFSDVQSCRELGPREREKFLSKHGGPYG